MSSPDPARPNILLVMTDQQRWDAMSCVSDWLRTPNIDRIAASGTRFSDAYTNSPVCVPARVSLATGRYPHNHGVWGNQRYTLPPTTPTWMQALRGAGYATSVFGKTHLHPHTGDLRDREHLVQAYGLDHVDEIAGPRATTHTRSHMTDRWEGAGVYKSYLRDLRDRFDNKAWVARPTPVPLEHYADVYVGQQSKARLQQHDPYVPWMCWASFGGPHEPWDAPEPYASMFDPASMPPPWERIPDTQERPQGRLDRKMAKGPAFEPGDVGRLRANYAGNMALIDDQIGELLAVLEERGELENTVIALVADHGEMNGDFGLLYKQNFLNPAVRVPFLVSAPGMVGGATSAAPVELMDIGATLLELAGVEPIKGSHARSVVPVLQDPLAPHRDAALSEFAGEVMLATTEWKMSLNRHGEIFQLFDLINDPRETRNLAALPEVADVEQELRRLALQRLVQTAR
ncbi:MAG: sulfatase-like hydrolase/transferase [Nocardioides sp.]